MNYYYKQPGGNVDDLFSTYDLDIAALLLTKGFDLKKVSYVPEENRSYFLFSDRYECSQYYFNCKNQEEYGSFTQFLRNKFILRNMAKEEKNNYIDIKCETTI